jgi:hypothetical protein
MSRSLSFLLAASGLLLAAAWAGNENEADAHPAAATARSAALAAKSAAIPKKASQPGSSERFEPTPETARAIARLARMARDVDPERNPWANDARLEHMSTQTPPAEPVARMRFDVMLALETLGAGRTEEAVAAFEDVWERIRQVPGWRSSRFGQDVHALLALAHMRRGEQENCVLHHGTESCLLPIRGSGVHVEQRGSRRAIREYTEILEQNPHDLASRWLLNVASMTVGDWPDAVPAAWLVPPSAFESDHDVGRFHDVAAKAGVDAWGLAGAAMMEDFDGDGYLDVMVTSFGLTDRMQLFLNERDGTFRDRTEWAGLSGMVSGLNAVHADFDNDGDVDVFVPRGAWLRDQGQLPPSLLRNRGNGRFDDVAESAGVLRYRPSQVAAWGDYDNDGWVDLFVGAETSAGGPEHPTSLYRNNRDGTFTDVAAAAGAALLGYVKGAVWGDYDNDGRLDLYVTMLQGAPANVLLHNEGPDAAGGWKFRDVGAEAGVRGPASAFPTWFFDYDNDGWLDLFASGYAGTVEDVAADYLGKAEHADGDTPRLYRNQHDGTFRDVTREAGVETVLMTMGCNFGDLDNDGWMDFYVATGNPDFRTLVPNRMFRNAGGRSFQDVTTAGGFGHLQKGHGVAFGDIDNDGDQDVYLKVGGALAGDAFRSALFENPGHGNRWITLRLVGVESNRAAIGARIRVTVDEGQARRDVHVTVTTGSSFGGNSLRQEIGLGNARRVRSLEVLWPATGKRQVFENVPMDRMYEIREGDPELRPIALERLKLGGK